MLRELGEQGIEHTWILGYANSYAGYCATPEEYQLQLYEGASTHFGQWTQPAYQTLFRRLSKRFCQDIHARAPLDALRPPPVTPEELEVMKAPDVPAPNQLG